MNSPYSRLKVASGLILALSLLGIDPATDTGELHSTASAQGGSIPTGTPFVVLPAADFQVRFGTAKFQTGTISRHCDANECSFVRGVQLPNQAKVLGMELDACDDDAFNKIRVVLRSYPAHEAGPKPSLLTIDNQATAGPCQYFLEVAPAPIPVDQFFGTHVVEVAMSQWTAGGGAPDSKIRFQAVRIYYEAGDGILIPTLGTTTVLSE